MVAQWLRIYLTMQEIGVQTMVWEDSTCHGTTKAHVLELLSPCSRACKLRLLSPGTTTLEACVIQGP